MIIHFAFLLVSLFNSNFGAVVAPPWADPILNPCALLPRGWQMLYWPPDGKCYKIFKVSNGLTTSTETGLWISCGFRNRHGVRFSQHNIECSRENVESLQFFYLHYSKFHNNRFTFACQLIHRMVNSFITLLHSAV